MNEQIYNVKKAHFLLTRQSILIQDYGLRQTLSYIFFSCRFFHFPLNFNISFAWNNLFIAKSFFLSFHIEKKVFIQTKPFFFLCVTLCPVMFLHS